MAASGSPLLMHPLCGADIGTLVRVLTGNGGVAVRALPQAGLALAMTIARLPITVLERFYVAHKLRGAGEMAAPIFIIGHWRSGTTHLLNILSKHEFSSLPPLASGIPWDFMILVAMLRPFLERLLPEGRYVDALPVAPDSPQEDEISLANMTPLSLYHGIYFPRAFARNFDRGVFFEGCTEAEIAGWKRAFVHLSRKTWLQGGRRPLLIKNPVYTARIKTILEIWPDAKFIHCVRDPHEVFASMRNFYRTLFPLLSLQDYDHLSIDDIVLDGYTRLMDRYLDERPAIPEGQFYELRYERLSAAPMDEIARLYGVLGLEGYAEAAPKYRRYLESVRSYTRNDYGYPAEDVARVEGAWGRFLDHWHYGRPAA